MSGVNIRAPKTPEAKARQLAASEKNLAGNKWKKGQSGNPGGRPKKAITLISDAYRDKLQQLVPGDKEGRTYAELLAAQIILVALKGSVPAAQEIRKSTEGDKLDISTDWRAAAAEHGIDEVDLLSGVVDAILKYMG